MNNDSLAKRLLLAEIRANLQMMEEETLNADDIARLEAAQENTANVIESIALRNHAAAERVAHDIVLTDPILTRALVAAGKAIMRHKMRASLDRRVKTMNRAMWAAIKEAGIKQP